MKLKTLWLCLASALVMPAIAHAQFVEISSAKAYVRALQFTVLAERVCDTLQGNEEGKMTAFFQAKSQWNIRGEDIAPNGRFHQEALAARQQAESIYRDSKETFCRAVEISFGPSGIAIPFLIKRRN